MVTKGNRNNMKIVLKNKFRRFFFSFYRMLCAHCEDLKHGEKEVKIVPFKSTTPR